MPPAGSEAFDRRLDPYSTAPLAVAFSGGSDSLALLAIAKAWGDRVGRSVVALTVDHGLSASSQAWTAAAAATAARLQVGWRGLAWTGAKPSSGLPAAARQVRHALLAEAARELGARVVALGHTADDQRESDLIRHETQSLGYLREWSPSPVWPQGRDIFLLRPLLGARRMDLRAWLASLGLGWLDDPANDDPRFARARARACLTPTAADHGPSCPDVFRASGETCPTSVLEMRGTDDGRLSLARTAFWSEPATTLLQVVGAALLCAAGTGAPARTRQLEILLDRARGAENFIATLCGARVVAEPTEIVFAREAGELRRGGAASTDADEVFDGRFEVACDPACRVTALAGRAGRLGRGDARALSVLPAYARGSLPALVDGAGRVSLPAPFGGGPGEARTLVVRRMAAACQLIQRESDLSTEGVWRPDPRPTMFFESILG